VSDGIRLFLALLLTFAFVTGLSRQLEAGTELNVALYLIPIALGVVGIVLEARERRRVRRDDEARRRRLTDADFLFRRQRRDPVVFRDAAAAERQGRVERLQRANGRAVLR
jgi:hypothetical protein